MGLNNILNEGVAIEINKYLGVWVAKVSAHERTLAVTASGAGATHEDAIISAKINLNLLLASIEMLGREHGNHQ